jgi:CDP-glucose 4,6-dehydratase
VASVRAGNVIGGGDWGRDRIVPDIVRSLQSDTTVRVRHPAAIRPWQHVTEPLSGYLQLASMMLDRQDPGLCDGWNFGPDPDQHASVGELVTLFLDSWGSGTWTHQPVANGTRIETEILQLSIHRAGARLGWRPRWAFPQAVSRTARWYRRFADNHDRPMVDACLDDITAYEQAGNARDD